MTEDRVATVPRDDLQKLFECPVCVQVFRNPRLLPCGHSVCAECCAQLNRDRVSLLCPVCRRPSTILADRLPINFGLRDLVNHYVDSDDKKKFSCANCDRKVTENDCWSCDDCSKIVCSFCAIKLHTLHTLKEIKDLLRDKESEINKWREDVSQIGKQIQSIRQQIDANEPRMKTGLRLLTNTVTKKLMPQLENERRNLINELNNIQVRCESVNAVRLIMDDSKIRHDFNCLKSEHQSFLEKQRKLLERQTEVVGALRRCEATLASYVTNPPIIVDNTITFSTFLGRNNASPVNHEDMSVDVDWISSTAIHNRRRPCDTTFRLRMATNTSQNDEPNSTVRLRRTRPSSDNRQRFCPDLLNRRDEDENVHTNPQQSNANHLSMFSSDEDILLASQAPQSYFTRNNDRFRSTVPHSQIHMFMCDRAAQNNPNSHITDESDIEEDMDRSANRENLAAPTAISNPVITAFRGHPKNLSTPLNRLFNQIERRMNNDLDDHHSDLDSNLVEMDRDAQLNDLSDEITILPTSSSSAVNRTAMDSNRPTTSSANQTNVGTKNELNVHKRSISQSDSSEDDLIEGEDDNEEEIDSAIRFRILRKR